MNWNYILSTVLWFMSSLCFLGGLILEVVIISLWGVKWGPGIIYLGLIPGVLSAILAALACKIDPRS